MSSLRLEASSPPVKDDQIAYASMNQDQNFYALLNKYYWTGSFENTDLFTSNYFAKYINQIILPGSSSSTEYENNIASFVNQVKTTGIVVDLPSNLSIKLFVNSYYQFGINPWYQINQPVNQVVIKMPDLVVEGISYPNQVDEAWGETLIYIVDGTPYSFPQTDDDLGFIVPPLIGIEVLADSTFTVNFETRTDATIPSQAVLSGSVAETPPTPTRLGHTFYGWTINPSTPEIVPGGQWPLTFWPHNTTITDNTTFYALWRKQVFNVTLALNGGSRIPGITGFSTNTLYVDYQNNVYNNNAGVDFDNMVYRSGYALDGWFTNASLTTPFNPETQITSNITIYAKWSKVYSAISDLPDTLGNPYSEGETGTATFSYVNGNFEAEIMYEGNAYNIQKLNAGFSSSSFLSNVASVSYYSIDGDKYLQFNYAGSPNVLLNATGQATNHWSGFGLWNLTKNQISITQRALVLTYINMDKSTRDAFAYMYMPTVVMDDLMSVSVVFNYRYLYPFGLYGKWQDGARVLERGVESLGGVPQDVLNLYSLSGVALGAGAIIPVLRWPLLITGGILFSVASYKAIDHLLTGAIEEIEPVSASQTFRLELNEYYTKLAGRPINVGTAQQVYKLYLGKFSALGSIDAEIDNDTYKYTEITWVTDGEVYSLTAPYLDQHSIINQGWLDRIEGHGELRLPNWVKSIIMIAITVIFIFGVVFKSNFFKNWRTIIPIGIVYAISMILISILI